MSLKVPPRYSFSPQLIGFKELRKNSANRDCRPQVITIDLGNMKVWVTIDIGKLKGIIISMVIMFYVVITLKVDFAYI